MAAEENAHLEVSRPMFGAPHVGCADPKQLAGSEVEAGEERLLTMLSHPGL